MFYVYYAKHLYHILALNYLAEMLLSAFCVILKFTVKGYM